MKKFLATFFSVAVLMLLPVIAMCQDAPDASKAKKMPEVKLPEVKISKPKTPKIKPPKAGIFKFGQKRHRKWRRREGNTADSVNTRIAPQLNTVQSQIQSINTESNQKIDVLIQKLKKYDTPQIVYRESPPIIKTNNIVVLRNNPEQPIVEPIKEYKPKQYNPDEVQQQIDFMRLLLDKDSIAVVKSPDSIGANLVTVSTAYQFKMRRKMDVLGFYPQNEGSITNDNPDFKFRLLSGIATNKWRLNWRTGSLDDAEWLTDTTTEIQRARNQDVRVMLRIFNKNPNEQERFLTNANALYTFFSKLTEVSGSDGYNGVVIDFEGLKQKNSRDFSFFIIKLRNYLRASGNDLKVYVVVPPYQAFDTEPLTYDVVEMAPYVDKFIIDFSKSQYSNGPLMPLKSPDKNSLTNTIARFLTLGIPTTQLMAGISYSALKWQIKRDSTLGSPEYYPFNSIRDSTLSINANMDNDAFSKWIDFSGVGVRQKIWFDDQSTLITKYDYLAQQNIGGIAIMLNDTDNFYSEYYNSMWDALLLKSFDVDTLILQKDTADHHLSFFESLGRDWKYYRKLLVNHNEVDPATYKMPWYLGACLLIALAVLLISVIIYYVLYTRHGVLWEYKRVGKYILIGEGVIVVLAGCLYAFLNPAFDIGVNFKGRHLGFSDLAGYLFAGISIGVISMIILFNYNKADKP